MNERRTATSRLGFTLLEVIIASSLATLLILLVWSLFSVYSKLNDRGDRQATELQLVRSLMHQLRSDLHHASAALEPGRVRIAAIQGDSWLAVSDGEPSGLRPPPSGALKSGASRLPWSFPAPPGSGRRCSRASRDSTASAPARP